MFDKVSKLKMLPPGRPARGVDAPANDNRRNARPGALQRRRTARLVCRWSLSPDTGRPVCRWELDNADDPSPREQLRSIHSAQRLRRMDVYERVVGGAGLI